MVDPEEMGHGPVETNVFDQALGQKRGDSIICIFLGLVAFEGDKLDGTIVYEQSNSQNVFL